MEKHCLLVIKVMKVARNGQLGAEIVLPIERPQRETISNG